MVYQTINQSFHYKKTQYLTIIHGNVEVRQQLLQNCENYIMSNCPRKDCQEETLCRLFVLFSRAKKRPDPATGINASGSREIRLVGLISTH